MPNVAPRPRPKSAKPDLATLAATINREHASGDAARRKGLQHYHQAGVALLKAKEECRLKKLKWGEWLAKNCPEIHERTDRRYRALAEADVTSDLESEWRRICGNVPANGQASDANQTEQSPPPHDPAPENGKQKSAPRQTAKPEDASDPPDAKPLPFKLTAAEREEWNALVNYLGTKVFKLTDVKAVIFEALKFAKERAGA